MESRSGGVPDRQADEEYLDGLLVERHVEISQDAREWILRRTAEQMGGHPEGGPPGLRPAVALAAAPAAAGAPPRGRRLTAADYPKVGYVWLSKGGEASPGDSTAGYFVKEDSDEAREAGIGIFEATPAAAAPAAAPVAALAEKGAEPTSREEYEGHDEGDARLAAAEGGTARKALWGTRRGGAPKWWPPWGGAAAAARGAAGGVRAGQALPGSAEKGAGRGAAATASLLHPGEAGLRKSDDLSSDYLVCGLLEEREDLETTRGPREAEVEEAPISVASGEAAAEEEVPYKAGRAPPGLREEWARTRAVRARRAASSGGAGASAALERAADLGLGPPAGERAGEGALALQRAPGPKPIVVDITGPSPTNMESPEPIERAPVEGAPEAARPHNPYMNVHNPGPPTWHNPGPWHHSGNAQMPGAGKRVAAASLLESAPKRRGVRAWRFDRRRKIPFNAGGEDPQAGRGADSSNSGEAAGEPASEDEDGLTAAERAASRNEWGPRGSPAARARATRREETASQRKERRREEPSEAPPQKRRREELFSQAGEEPSEAPPSAAFNASSASSSAVASRVAYDRGSPIWGSVLKLLERESESVDAASSAAPCVRSRSS